MRGDVEIGDARLEDEIDMQVVIGAGMGLGMG
jgi:hypothetical protein